MEIEKKYIVSHLPSDLDAYPHHEISQGYLSTEPVLRIRRKDDLYILTYKSKGMMVREEHEFSLTKEAFEHLSPKADGNMITKTRYLLPTSNDLTIELDVFHGIFEGLVIAEVEFPSVEMANAYEKPEWFAKEVTTDGRYHNSYLSGANNEQIKEVIDTMLH